MNPLAAVADFDRLPIPGSIIELDGTLVAVNQAATQLLGRPSTQVVGRKVWDFAPGAEYIWADVVDGARVAEYRSEIALATPQGSRTIQYVATVRRHDGRELVLVFVIESQATDEEHEQRIESLGRVAGGIAHDFNNQLVSVLAEASSAREDAAATPALHESLRRIEAAAQRMALLTRQLLAYAGRGRFVSEALEPDALLDDMREQLERTVRSDAELSIRTGARGAVIEADRGLLREVIANVVLNASESLPPRGGRIHVATSFVPRDPQRASWRLFVTDDGVGMDARTVARIFDPFFTTKSDRHGMGLSAVHGIVRRLGGEIVVDSRPGGGTVFEIRVPLADRSVVKAASAPTARGTAASLASLAILVADDEPSVRSTIRRLLERRGATVALAVDGGDASAQLRAGRFDLVVLDVMMPHLTGYELLPIVRQTQPSARVLLMSGYTDAARGAGGEEEADLFLEKPFTARELDAAIDRLIERR